MVRTYSKKRNGTVKLTPHFRVGEFACNDGSDKILIDYNLVTELEKIRIAYGKPITFTSAYRTPKWNKKYKGEVDSMHLYGKAVDISKAEHPGILNALKKSKLFILNEGGWWHVDCRYIAPDKKYPVLKRGGRGEWVIYLQQRLSDKGYKCVRDGAFGGGTKKQLILFQKRNRIVPNGICDGKTWGKLK